MTTITFDTLKFANRLKAAGVPDKQAEAEAEALAEVFETNWQELATKEDLRLVQKDLKNLEERLELRLVQLEQRIVIKLGTLMAGAIGIVAVLVKLL